MNTFNVGDKVRIRKSVEQFYSTSVRYSELTVVGADAKDDTVSVRRVDSASPGVWIKAESLELAVDRIEGKEIKPEAIKVGDEILVTMVSGELTVTHQGVVSDINATKDQYGARLIFSNKVRQRINWGRQHREETFTLVKAAPERDVLMDRLVGALVGQVVLYRTSLARKRNDEGWDILTGNGIALTHGTPDLRAIIGSSIVTWLAPEAKAV